MRFSFSLSPRPAINGVAGFGWQIFNLLILSPPCGRTLLSPRPAINGVAGFGWQIFNLRILSPPCGRTLLSPRQKRCASVSEFFP